MRTSITTLLMAALFASGATAGDSAASELSRLVDMMSGSFSSATQAAADSDFFDIRLEMTPIWRERSDAAWLYVEQARGDLLDKPYRQRVYRVARRDDGALVSEVFTFSSPLRYAGAWKQASPLASLTPDSLSRRDGCAIVLRAQPDGTFVGATVDHDCPSDLRGAAYATSEVTMGSGVMVSWDRGWNVAGEQVWGARKGGYVFRKAAAR